jgi:hypothetical protein
MLQQLLKVFEDLVQVISIVVDRAGGFLWKGCKRLQAPRRFMARCTVVSRASRPMKEKTPIPSDILTIRDTVTSNIQTEQNNKLAEKLPQFHCYLQGFRTV